MRIVEFGPSIIDYSDKITFANYSDVVAIRKRLLFDDIQNEQTVYTGQGIHGFAALLFGMMCNATIIIAIDAPSFLDTHNKELYNDTRVFEHSFLKEHQDVLAHIEPNCETKCIMNVPTCDVQKIHTERIHLMIDNVIITDDYENEMMRPISETPRRIKDVVPCITSKPFRAGNFNNYHHFWVDHIISIVEHCHAHAMLKIKLCNKESLITTHSVKVLKMFGIDAQMTYDESGIIVQGKNPKFTVWDKKLIDKVRNVASWKTCEPVDVVYIKRPRTKRYIDNEDDFMKALEQFNTKCVSVETMSIQEQIDTFSRAKVVIGQYGSGLTNVMFMKPGTCCIEIDKCYRKRYDVLCHFFDMKHFHFQSVEHDLSTMKSKIEAEKVPINIDKCIDFIRKMASL